jgi:hypothetical protein
LTSQSGFCAELSVRKLPDQRPTGALQGGVGGQDAKTKEGSRLRTRQLVELSNDQNLWMALGRVT